MTVDNQSLVVVLLLVGMFSLIVCLIGFIHGIAEKIPFSKLTLWMVGVFGAISVIVFAKQLQNTVDNEWSIQHAKECSNLLVLAHSTTDSLYFYRLRKDCL